MDRCPRCGFCPTCNGEGLGVKTSEEVQEKARLTAEWVVDKVVAGLRVYRPVDTLSYIGPTATA